ncbi:MAG: hypothetical protein L0I76_23985 [Pseudonocardia sp.]|nr:hypothetical protein [Pseudonocardia sp.]
MHGVPTATLADLVAGGEPVRFVADTYGFDPTEIEQAVSFEASKHRAA